MARWIGWMATALAAGSLAACASTPKGATAFLVETRPAGAAVETTQGYRCTTPCQVPIVAVAVAVTVSSVGYKPVQLPVEAGRNPGKVTIRLVPQDPGAGAPNPVGKK